MRDSFLGRWRTKWANDLSERELRVLDFIVRRTVFFRKVDERIPLRHFLHGVQNSKTGVWLARKVGMAKRVLLDVLERLQIKGYIHKLSYCTGNVYGLILDRNNKAFYITTYNDIKDLPVAEPTNISFTYNYNIYNNNISASRGIYFPPKEKRQVEAMKGDTEAKKRVMSAVKAVTGRMLDENKQKRTIGNYWESLAKKHYSSDLTCHVLTIPQRVNLSRKLENTPYNQKLLEYTISRWSAIMLTEFRWMTKIPPPDLPNVWFFLRFKKIFVKKFERYLNGARAAICKEKGIDPHTVPRSEELDGLNKFRLIKAVEKREEDFERRVREWDENKRRLDRAEEIMRIRCKPPENGEEEEYGEEHDYDAEW